MLMGIDLRDLTHSTPAHTHGVRHVPGAIVFYWFSARPTSTCEWADGYIGEQPGIVASRQVNEPGMELMSH